ncbi:MAG: anti-sigma F factor [Clostridia bacterium]|nr:anti-sigma F factor [Clostridia bacterium]
MKEMVNCARVRFPALGENEGFARLLTAGFLMHLQVTPAILADVKTMVSEAVTNAIVHGYRGREGKKCFVFLELKFYSDRTLMITVTDLGRGIDNVEDAMEPFFTTDREGERSGMGLPIMQAFSDSLRIRSRPGRTVVTMRKKLP